MARLSVNELTTFRWTFEEDVTRYAAAGIPAIGVWRQKLSDFGEEKAVELLKESGLAVSNLLWAGGFTGSDGRRFRECLEDATEAIRLAAALEAGCLVVYTGPRAGHTHNHARRLTCDAIKALLPIAGEFGVPLAFEPMHPGCAGDWTFLTGIDETLSLLERFDSKYLGLVLDTYHLGFEPNLLERIPQLLPKVRIVHLGDGKAPPVRESNRVRLGDGIVPLAEIVQCLLLHGYQGDFDVEILGEDLVCVGYHELIRHSREQFARLLEGAPSPQG